MTNLYQTLVLFYIHTRSSNAYTIEYSCTYMIKAGYLLRAHACQVRPSELLAILANCAK